MIKRIVCTILTLSLLITIFPVMSVPGHAASNDFLHRYDAAEGGLEVFTAWYWISEMNELDFLNDQRQYLTYNRLTKEIRNDKNILAALINWRKLTYNISSETEFSDKEKAVYESVLFDMLLGDNMSFSVTDIDSAYTDTAVSDTADLLGNEELNQLLDLLLLDKTYSNLKTRDSLWEFMKYADTDEDKDELMAAINRVTKNNKKLSNFNLFASEVSAGVTLLSEIFEITNDVCDALEKISKVAAIFSLDESFINVLEKLADPTNAGYVKVSYAAEDLYNFYVQNSDNAERNNAIIQYVVGNYTEAQLKKYASMAIWEGVTKFAGPLGIGINIGQSVGKFSCNILFGTEEYINILYTMRILSEIESRLFTVATYFRTEFILSPTKENAENFNSAIKVLYRFVLSSNQYSEDFVDNVFDSGLINKWFGNKQSYQAWLTLIKNENELYEEFLSTYDAACVDYYNETLKEISGYTITYNANGGSNAPTSQHKEHDVGINLSSKTPTPPSSKKQFVGWATSPKATTYSFNPSDIYYENADLNLYALYADKDVTTYTVSYNANNGTGAPSSHTNIEPGEKITVKSFSNLERDGFICTGWSDSSGAATPSYTKGDTITVNDNLILYAIWEIDIDLLEGTGIPGDINGDETVDNLDAIRLREYIDDTLTVTIDRKALDVTGDGYVDEDDFDALMKYINDWDITLQYGGISTFTVEHKYEGDMLDGSHQMDSGDAYQTWTVNSSDSWTAECSDDWFYLNKYSGNGDNNSVKIYFDANDSGAKRSGSVTFYSNDQEYEVEFFQHYIAVHHGTSLSNIVHEDIIGHPLEVSEHGGPSTWLVQCSRSWEAECQDSWYRFSNGSDYISGSKGTTTIKVQIDGNETGRDRSGSVVITFGDVEVTVNFTQPCQEVTATYDPEKAIEYALKYNGVHSGSQTYNPDYGSRLSDSDCANFVSQCLEYGGLGRTTQWKPGKTTWTTCRYSYTNKTDGLMTYLEDLGYTVYGYNKFTSSGATSERSININKIKRGDLIFSQNSNGALSGHVMIVDHVSGNYVYYHAHSNDRCGCGQSSCINKKSQGIYIGSIQSHVSMS